MREFFEALFNDHTGLVPIGRMSIGEDGVRKLNKTDWFQYPVQLDQMVAFCEQHADEDVYFSPQLYSERRRFKEYVTTTTVLWADADAARPEDFRLTPSIVVESSPNKYQLYWFVESEMPPKWAEAASKRIAYAHRDQGCDTGWALTKYLRVPRTTNTKYDDDFTVTYKNNGVRYTEDQYIKSYGDPAKATEYERSRELPVDLPSREEAVGTAKEKLSHHVIEMLTTQPSSDWSTVLWNTECSLARAGVDRETAFVLLKRAPCNKYARDGRPDSDLWDELCRAYEEVEANKVNINMPEVPVKGDRRLRMHHASFLSDAERQQVLNDTFIDRYTVWASGKTKADTNYHVMSAQCILATIYSDFGHATPQFGDLKLNLWFMLLGQTTKTFKTTARKLMMRVIHQVEQDATDDYQYDLGSDATTEGLLEDLATRPHRSGLFYRDEAQALIADSTGGKGYLAGLHTTFTELYDGTVRGRTRAGGKKSKAVETSLNMYLMGVPGDMSKALTVDDFKSGFLARMLFYIGKPAERDKLKQSDGTDNDPQSDQRFNELVSELILSRRHWENLTNPGSTLPIKVKTDAWDRFNDLLDDLEAEADGDEIMMAAAHRMGMSALKLSCLLAMHERTSKVSMAHMLTAIKHCELWYAGLRDMSQRVSTTAWEAEMEAVVDELLISGKTAHGVLYRKFKANYKPKQFSELMDALTATHEVVVSINPQNNMRYYEVRV